MADNKETESGLVLKDYSRYSIKKLNKILRLRERQIASVEAGRHTTIKPIAQLKYERESILNTLLERAMSKST